MISSSSEKSNTGERRSEARGISFVGLSTTESREVRRRTSGVANISSLAGLTDFSEYSSRIAVSLSICECVRTRIAISSGLILVPSSFFPFLSKPIISFAIYLYSKSPVVSCASFSEEDVPVSTSESFEAF